MNFHHLPVSAVTRNECALVFIQLCWLYRIGPCDFVTDNCRNLNCLRICYYYFFCNITVVKIEICQLSSLLAYSYIIWLWNQIKSLFKGRCTSVILINACVVFLASVHLALFLALSFFPGNSLVSSWCDHSMLADLLWRCLTVPSLLQLC